AKLEPGSEHVLAKKDIARTAKTRKESIQQHVCGLDGNQKDQDGQQAQSKLFVCQHPGKESWRSPNSRNDEHSREEHRTCREEDSAEQLFVFAAFIIHGHEPRNCFLQAKCS